MKILIFSDSHLTDNFDEKKYNFLKKIVSACDRVIINGDFWDGYEVTFDQFIQSRWQSLFPLFIKKKTIYLFGNHDRKELADNRINLFSIKQTDHYLLQSGCYRFWIEHGNRFFPDWEKKAKIERLNRLINISYGIVENILFKIFGTHLQKWLFRRFNTKLKREVEQTIEKPYIYVCGHTHEQELDLNNRFINSGIMRHGLGQYIIIEDGKIILKEEWFA